MPLSTYDGVDGPQPRNDLAGLNLTTVPKAVIECGTMQNGTDAALLARARPAVGAGTMAPWKATRATRTTEVN
jgi:hypothetical protein